MTNEYDIDDIRKNYKPLTFKFLGMNRSEHFPKDITIDWLHLARVQLKSLLNMKLTYNDLRYSLAPESKKHADLTFITHFMKEHDRGRENMLWIDRFRYWAIYVRYLPEIRYLHSNRGDQEFTDYLLMWNYLSDPSPSFALLIHGIEKEQAQYALEN